MGDVVGLNNKQKWKRGKRTEIGECKFVKHKTKEK